MTNLNIPVGVSDFSQIRENEYYYVDKTGLILQGLLANIRHQGQMSCSLDSYSQSSLMFSTVASDTSRKDFSSLGYVSL